MKRHRGRAIQLYLVLLALSHLQTCVRAPDAPGTREVRAKETGLEPEVWVLIDPLDASSGRLENYASDRMQRGLPTRVPTLPGLNVAGRGGRHSFENLAKDLALEMKNREESLVVLANGHAGAVGLHLAANRPGSIDALGLLDATGVQELSLLGEYHLNYALYAVSDLSLGFFHAFTPHFDLWPRLRLQQEQIRLLRRSDRRTLRPVFENIEVPVLIMQHPQETLRHQAAREHERLLPQSQRITIPPEEDLTPVLEKFLKELKEGSFPPRALAAPERVAAALETYDPAIRPPASGPALWLLLFAIALATVFTEDLTCALTGLMIANGNLTWAQGIGACLTGILVYDYAIYVAGRVLGRPALTRIPLRWMIDPLTLRETEEWFDRRVGGAILVTRFIPGTRGPAYLAAGILGVPAKVFTPIFVLAALVWTPLIIFISHALAEKALDWISRYQHTAPALVVVAIALYLLFTHVLLPACSWRGRRKLLGRWRRMTRPEFTPPFLLYLPVLLRLLGRSLRKGNHFFDFTACNPCIPGSGLPGESKSAILDLIHDKNALAPYQKIPDNMPVEERVSLAEQFLSGESTRFPLVLKPDVSQRGNGMLIFHDFDSLRKALGEIKGEHILQAFQEGNEYGVFVKRNPGETRTRIFAITLKTLPTVTGDGRRNLEDLILADPRAVCFAKTYFDQNRNQLYEIPQKGVAVTLSRRGNHTHGAVYGDGMGLLTPRLQAKIDDITRGIQGFHLGRFDLFAPSHEAFSMGRDMKIIQLSGIASVAASVYAPPTSHRKITSLLVEQWLEASRIGKANREKGAKIYTFRQFMETYDKQRKVQYERLSHMFGGNRKSTT